MSGVLLPAGLFGDSLSRQTQHCRRQRGQPQSPSDLRFDGPVEHLRGDRGDVHDVRDGDHQADDAGTDADPSVSDARDSTTGQDQEHRNHGREAQDQGEHSVAADAVLGYGHEARPRSDAADHDAYARCQSSDQIRHVVRGDRRRVRGRGDRVGRRGCDRADVPVGSTGNVAFGAGAAVVFSVQFCPSHHRSWAGVVGSGYQPGVGFIRHRSFVVVLYADRARVTPPLRPLPGVTDT